MTEFNRFQSTDPDDRVDLTDVFDANGRVIASESAEANREIFAPPNVVRQAGLTNAINKVATKALRVIARTSITARKK